MLKPVKASSGKNPRRERGQFIIVASQYNARYVDAMVRAATNELRGALARKVKVIRVPGAHEIPVVVARLARGGVYGTGASPGPGRSTPGAAAYEARPAAIICLGVILRGETVHAAHIGEGVSRALMELQVKHEVPIIHEVLLLENEQQARARCLSKTHNRGTEAARTALAMARVMRELRVAGG